MIMVSKLKSSPALFVFTGFYTQLPKSNVLSMFDFHVNKALANGKVNILTMILHFD